ncbi:TetR/AcrR family transcriptional regulator [Euzebya tangerina]|uniref:TetR/AcrR family transcriptional regulator n=1 Tax=Euzebya tangerina TaxID=591198 RepID=UPI000E321EB3|nr:TetR/AcrR family transcriptional regulator [Euzebya tangerina]
MTDLEESREAETDPRVQRTLEEVHAAVLRLLADGGIEAVTHSRVAEISAVSRATVYRHFSDRDDLIASALAASVPPTVPVQRTDDAIADLRAFLKAVGAALCSQQALPDLIKLANRASRDPDLAVARQHIVSLGDSPVTPLLRDGIAQGWLRDDLDIEIATMQLMGPLFAVTALALATVTDELVDRHVDAWLTGHAAPRSVSRLDQE